MQKTRYTKKLFNQLLVYVVGQWDFKHYYYEFRKGKVKKSFQDCCIECLNSYLYDDFEYLDKEYQDISWYKAKQYGKDIIVDMDCVWDIFKDIVDSELKK